MSEVINSKKCSKCGEVKPSNQFGKAKDKKYGLTSQCKSCKSIYDTKRKEKLNKNPFKAPIGIESKKCTKCNTEKLLSEFSKNKKGVYGRDSDCKKCKIESYENRAWDYIDITVKKCNTCGEVKSVASFSKDRKSIDRYNTCCYSCKKIYIKKNKAKILKTSRKYYRNRKINDSVYVMNRRIRDRFKASIKVNYLNTNWKPLYNTIGHHLIEYEDYFNKYQPEMLQKYRETSLYHIDHIIPCTVYNFKNSSDLLKCWNPRNLRIIPAKENMDKGGKLIIELVEEYKIMDLLPEGLNG